MHVDFVADLLQLVEPVVGVRVAVVEHAHQVSAREHVEGRARDVARPLVAVGELASVQDQRPACPLGRAFSPYSIL